MVDLSADEFDDLVAEALDSLPGDITRLIKNVAIFVEEHSPPGRTLLGLYEGVPLTARNNQYMMAMPDRITIYRLPIQAICRNQEEVKEQVRITVVHEIAHHFGIDDARLHELGYA